MNFRKCWFWWHSRSLEGLTDQRQRGLIIKRPSLLSNAVLLLPVYLLYYGCKSQIVGETWDWRQQKTILVELLHSLTCTGEIFHFNLNFKGPATMWFYFYIQGNGNTLTDKHTLGLSARFMFNHTEKLPNPVGVSAFWWMNGGYVTGTGRQRVVNEPLPVLPWWNAGVVRHRWRKIHTLPLHCGTCLQFSGVKGVNVEHLFFLTLTLPEIPHVCNIAAALTHSWFN